jgi:peptide/nickel transport system substrate-binding protein
MEGRQPAEVPARHAPQRRRGRHPPSVVEKGDADVSPDLPPREIADISATKKFRVDSAPMANTLKYLALSTMIKPFDDVRVRQAVAYGIPYQKVIDSAVFGRAQPMFGASAAAPADASWPQPFPYAYDPDKAKALLRDAGLAAGFETKLFFDAQVATTDEPAACRCWRACGSIRARHGAVGRPMPAGRHCPGAGMRA